MRVRFWGTRGSIATPGESTVRYGGNTSCVELRSASGTVIVFDCGTGVRALGAALMDQAEKSGPVRGHILISHTHWDHIQGLPFFAPLFTPGNEWDIYAPRGFEQSLKETLAGQMQYTYFPITLSELPASIHYHEIVEGSFGIGDIRVTTQYLNHPALTLGYRIEVDDAVVVYACDHEPHSRQLAGGEGEVAGQDRRHAKFLAGADLVIHDAQYTADEYEEKKGWGHSTAEYAVEIARAAGVARLALTHHDPARDDAAVDRMVAAIRARVEASGTPIDVFAAAEGQVVELGAAERAVHSTVAAKPAPPPPETALIDHTVLVGVADPAAAIELCEAMPTEGIRVIVEADGERVLQQLLAAPPALAILDERLPGRGGVSIAQAYRRSTQPVAQELPIIVVTDREEPATTDEIGRAGEWLVRPFTSSYARTRIGAALLRTPCRWVKPPVPPDEESRLTSLANLGILDTPPEERFDRLTRLAAAIFDVPTALVSLIDRDRQWFKSVHGLDVRETPREVSFCGHAVAERAPMIVSDALNDPRFADNPYVVGGPRVRFYAGQPLILPDGSCVGTVCLIDTRPRELDEQALELLHDIGELVRRELLLTGVPPPARRVSSDAPYG